ncbi:MAG: 2-C-methyl-D-erythritol 2,4-cyclodiphosphate synthase [Euzebyaceae bacterium]|nr:2-C-methyl-D-erythritol 2,4-cyclodiphosphate synthase [Euzebyaceae bacterium]
MRVGQGVDVHAFSDDPDRPLVLGGLLLPGEQGLSGHSDADVVLHAVVDALLGAAALGDLGTVFGTDEPRYAGAPSSVFVEEAVRRVSTAGWSVMSVDVTIIAQRPRIDTHRTRIADAVQTLLGVTPGTVSVKATTTDGLGAIGKGAGMACQAIALVERT